jgi:hypothetical protein
MAIQRQIDVATLFYRKLKQMKYAFLLPLLCISFLNFGCASNYNKFHFIYDNIEIDSLITTIRWKIGPAFYSIQDCDNGSIAESIEYNIYRCPSCSLPSEFIDGDTNLIYLPVLLAGNIPKYKFGWERLELTTIFDDKKVPYTRCSANEAEILSHYIPNKYLRNWIKINLDSIGSGGIKMKFSAGLDTVHHAHWCSDVASPLSGGLLL